MKQTLVLALSVGSLFLASCSSSMSLEAPQNLRAVPGENKVELNWEDRSNNEAGFAVYRSLASERNFSKIEQTAANAESYTDNIDTSDAYIYQVRAFATNGSESAPTISDAVSATKPTSPNPNPTPNPTPVISSFTAPENDTTYAVGTTITLSWSIAEQATITELKLEPGNITITNPKTANSVNVTLPNTTTTTNYKLTATNSAGGASSQELDISTSEAPAYYDLETKLLSYLDNVPDQLNDSRRKLEVTWRMRGSGPFTFRLSAGNEIPTTEVTESNGVYTAIVIRPSRTEDGDPGDFYATSDYGDAPNTKAELFDRW